MTEQQRWVTIPVPSDPEENGGYTVGTSWQVSEGLKNAGRTRMSRRPRDLPLRRGVRQPR